MRRTSAALATLAAFVALAIAGAAGAQASPTVDHQAWTRTGPAAPPDPKAENIYVAAAGGVEQARAFLHVNVSGVDVERIAGSTIVLVPASDGVAADGAALIACALTSPLRTSGEIAAEPPAADCATRALLTWDSDGRWLLPLAAFAQGWSAGANHGLALVPDPDAPPTPFTVSLDTTKTAVDGPPATSPPPAQVPPSTVPPAAVAPTDAAPGEALEPPFTPLATEISPATDAPAAPPPATLNPPPAFEGQRGGGSAAHPSALLIAVPVLLAGALLLASARWGAASVWRPAAWVLLPLVVMTFGETTIYKIGLVLIAFVAAIGLHLLVNWTGELSLAHAGFIGVPAFAVAQLTANVGLSPILTLPLAVALGAALGSIVGVAALRSRGIQVAMVTLAVGIAIGQFLFFRTWLVGPVGGLQISVPEVFGLELRTSRSMLPFLVAVVLVAVLAARSVMESKIGRALLLVRADPDAAAAAGVAVARHRALAYSMAGSFAGVAGWSYVFWVQQVSAKAFPLQLGFNYLIMAALAGSGGLAGVATAALLIQGGALFSIFPRWFALYLAPIGLIVNVTRYQAGFNGLLRAARSVFNSRIGDDMENQKGPGPTQVRPLMVAGTLAIVAGFAAIGLAWYHLGNTDVVFVQNQELFSGGATGLGLIIVGATLILRDSILLGRATERSPSVEPEVALAPAAEPVAPAPPAPTANGPRRRRVLESAQVER